MSDSTSGALGVLKELDEAECLRLISPGGIGRIAFTGRYGPTVLPVNYRMHQGSVVFRTAHDSATDEDLRTGIENAEYRVAFEIDDFDSAAREGWSVLIQGAAHHVDSDDERAAVRQTGVQPWASGERELFMRIVPTRVTGRRIRQEEKAAPGSAAPHDHGSARRTAAGPGESRNRAAGSWLRRSGCLILEVPGSIGSAE
jgi:nitroimidazol reductase NimA-like FMN-containing flavoprotein (pyridoxamine 5'-phosphate oxidase superfamily)